MTHPAQQDEMPSDVIKFLLGEAPLDGYWFGEKPMEKPLYWWRVALRAHCDRLGKELNAVSEIAITEEKRAESAEYRLAALREECAKITAVYGKTNLGSHTSVQNFLIAFEDYAQAIRALKSNPTGRE